MSPVTSKKQSSFTVRYLRRRGSVSDEETLSPKTKQILHKDYQENPQVLLSTDQDLNAQADLRNKMTATVTAILKKVGGGGHCSQHPITLNNTGHFCPLSNRVIKWYNTA